MSADPARGERLWLSLSETATEIGISRKRLHNVIADGQLEAVKLGRRLVVRRSDLNAFLEHLRQQAS